MFAPCRDHRVPAPAIAREAFKVRISGSKSAGSGTKLGRRLSCHAPCELSGERECGYCSLKCPSKQSSSKLTRVCSKRSAPFTDHRICWRFDMSRLTT